MLMNDIIIDMLIWTKDHKVTYLHNNLLCINKNNTLTDFIIIYIMQNNLHRDQHIAVKGHS